MLCGDCFIPLGDCEHGAPCGHRLRLRTTTVSCEADAGHDGRHSYRWGAGRYEWDDAGNQGWFPLPALGD